MRPPIRNTREIQTVVAGKGQGVQSARGGGLPDGDECVAPSSRGLRVMKKKRLERNK